MIFLRRRSKTVGPIDLVAFKKLVKNKKLVKSDEVANDSTGPWRTLGDVFSYLLANGGRLPEVDTEDRLLDKTASTMTHPTQNSGDQCVPKEDVSPVILSGHDNMIDSLRLSVAEKLVVAGGKYNGAPHFWRLDSESARNASISKPCPGRYPSIEVVEIVEDKKWVMLGGAFKNQRADSNTIGTLCVYSLTTGSQLSHRNMAEFGSDTCVRDVFYEPTEHAIYANLHFETIKISLSDGCTSLSNGEKLPRSEFERAKARFRESPFFVIYEYDWKSEEYSFKSYETSSGRLIAQRNFNSQLSFAVEGDSVVQVETNDDKTEVRYLDIQSLKYVKSLSIPLLTQIHHSRYATLPWAMVSGTPLIALTRYDEGQAGEKGTAVLLLLNSDTGELTKYDAPQNGTKGERPTAIHVGPNSCSVAMSVGYSTGWDLGTSQIWLWPSIAQIGGFAQIPLASL